MWNVNGFSIRLLKFFSEALHFFLELKKRMTKMGIPNDNYCCLFFHEVENKSYLSHCDVMSHFVKSYKWLKNWLALHWSHKISLDSLWGKKRYHTCHHLWCHSDIKSTSSAIKVVHTRPVQTSGKQGPSHLITSNEGHHYSFDLKDTRILSHYCTEKSDYYIG